MSYASPPFHEFILKLSSLCDLACDHCYVYEHADQSWRDRPTRISPSTTARFAERLAEHATAHRLPAVRVVLHGGEPLLVGPQRMREILATLDAAISPVTRLAISIHTNGVLLTDSFLELFAEFDVSVGVSLDGGRAANDHHRRYRDGRSSYDQVTAALARLRGRPEYSRLFSGLLATIDLANDPIAVYRGLLAQQPPRVDLLLPHANWEHQPPGLTFARDPRQPTNGDGEYVHWLTTIFDAWDADGRPVPVRVFESVLAGLHGRPMGTEALGLDPVNLLVVETDGTLEQVDSLKSAYDGAAATGLDLWGNSFDDAVGVAGIASRQRGIEGVSAVCRDCELVRVCGGGLYPHRYRAGHGFDNPSVYCADLKGLITHIADFEMRHNRASSTSGAIRVETPHPTMAAAHDTYTGLDLRAEDFAALAAGFGSAAAIETLARNEAVVQRDLLALVARRGPQHDERFTDAWDLLASLSVTAPDAVAATLAHPYTRAWATKLLTSRQSGSCAADVHHLEAVAASAAVRAGLDARVPIPVRGGVVPLPGFGALAAPAAAEDDDQLWCETGSVNGFDLFQPVRHVDTAGLRIVIEDTDPYRDCHGYQAERLSSMQIDEWARALPEAVAYIDEHLPAYSAGLRAGLTTIAPMRRPEDGRLRSAAARHAFGAIGVALPEDPALLALLMIHEMQHVKLGALLDIAELYDRSDSEPRYFAPWRTDPRPLEGLFQGTYAHIAVVDYLRARRGQVDGAERKAVDAQFTGLRTDTAAAADRLLKSGSLTSLGLRFVEGMKSTLDAWQD